MSGMDNWLKLSRWWQEHFVLSERRPSSIGFRSVTNPQLGNVKKCAARSAGTMPANPSRSVIEEDNGEKPASVNRSIEVPLEEIDKQSIRKWLFEENRQ